MVIEAAGILSFIGIAVVAGLSYWAGKASRLKHEERSYQDGYKRGHREGYTAGVRNRRVQR